MKNIYLLFLLMSACTLNAQTNYALSFNAVDHQNVFCGYGTYIDIYSSPITIEAWIYQTSFAANSFDGVIVAKDATPANGYTLRCGGAGILSFALGDGTNWFEVTSSSGALKLNTWQHVAGVFDGSNATLYIDGAASGTVNASGRSIATTNKNLYIGGSNEFYRFFTGNIDEVRIWNIARTSGQINSAMHTDLTGDNTGLAAYYRMSDGSGTSLTDNSGKGNTGTLQSGVTWTVVPATLPVELVSFTAEVAEKSVELKWRTATEVNNYGFEVERCAVNDRHLEGDGHLAWTKIGFVEGNGTTNAPKSYSFTDKSASGKTSYRLKQIDRDGKFEYSQTVEVTVASAPKEFALEQNYPNPFNPTTIISYQIPVSNHVSLKVFDMLGKEVATLVNETKETGSYSAKVDGTKLSSGIYFYKLQSGNLIAVKKLTIMK